MPAPSRSRAARVALSLVALALLCGAISWMSAQPATDSAKASGGIAEWVARLFTPNFAQLSPAEQLERANQFDHLVRKTAHFVEYATLGALSFNAAWQLADERQRARVGRLALPSWAFAVAYAASDELHQRFVPGRSGELRDVALDSSGALCGVLLAAALVAWLARRRASR